MEHGGIDRRQALLNDSLVSTTGIPDRAAALEMENGS